MNVWIFSAGLLGLFTSLVHIFAGQVDPVRPFLKSDLTDTAKATLLACWHMISVLLVFASSVLTYAGWSNSIDLLPSAIAVSIAFSVFSMIFIAVGGSFFGFNSLIKLPQWLLLLTIGVLGLTGAIEVLYG